MASRFTMFPHFSFRIQKSCRLQVKRSDQSRSDREHSTVRDDSGTEQFPNIKMEEHLKVYRKNSCVTLNCWHFTTISLIIVCTIPLRECFPTPGVHVDGYQEENVPTYPFQQYIQVRKTYSVEHIPVYGKVSNPSESTPSSNHREDPHHAASTNAGDSENDYHRQGSSVHQSPRLREEISDYKKHEVYEEKGYGDSGYDHSSYRIPTHGHPQNSYPEESLPEGSSPKRQTVASHLHTPDGSSTKLLEYVASNLHDTSAQEKGIYAARSNVYCPEVIDFDLSSRKMGMGKGENRGAKPRLQGLGSKIDCLKNKYFGREPLPRAIFAEPSESKHSVIEAPSFKTFFDMVRESIDTSSTFQNGKMPI